MAWAVARMSEAKSGIFPPHFAYAHAGYALRNGLNPHFSHSMRPALLFRRGRYSVGRRKAYRGIRLSRPTLEMPAERQPKGPVQEADRVRRRACPMSHIARRAAPALSAS